MRRPHQEAAAGVLLALALIATGGWVRWHRWQADLPPPLAPAQAESLAIQHLEAGRATTAVPIRPADLQYPGWLMALRRPFAGRREHVRTWLVAVRLRSRVPLQPLGATPPPADVW